MSRILVKIHGNLITGVLASFSFLFFYDKREYVYEILGQVEALWTMDG
jgi:hypothetical protein